ncbi:hypothetical protein JCM8097_005255 [Rhodosporidiobolus ruineniae]
MGLFSSEQPPTFASSSSSPAPPPSYQHPHPTSSFASTSKPLAPVYWALHLASSDKLRLIGADEQVRGIVDGVITSTWRNGVQQSKVYDQVSWEWKLRGYPWASYGPDTIPSVRLLLALFSSLSSAGYHLAVSLDLSMKARDKDSLIFRSGVPTTRRWFAVSFVSWDKVQVMDAPDEAVRAAFVHAIRSTWPLGIQQEKAKDPSCYQLKLKGYPFSTSVGSEVNHARLLACALLATMDGLGYELVSSVDMRTGSGEDSTDLDTWFFASKV